MMKVPFFIALFCAIQSFAQTKEVSTEEAPKPKLTLGERGLNRFFADGILGAGFISDHSLYQQQDEYGIITSIRGGNNFYLGKGNHPMIIRLTYLRIGITTDFGNPYLHIIPPQLGLVKHIKFNEMASMEPGVHVGYIFNGQISSGVSEFGLGVVYEIKFTIDHFAIGLEYGTRKENHGNSSYYQPYERHHYFGISVGTRIGRGF